MDHRDSAVDSKGAATDGPSRIAWPALDVTLWLAAAALGSLLRYDFQFAAAITGRLLVFAAIAAVLQVLVGLALGVYGVRHVRGSFDEVMSLVQVIGLVTLGMLLINALIEPQLVPLSVPAIAGLAVGLCMLAARFVVRSRAVSAGRQAGVESERTRAVIIGAGSGGRLLIQALRGDSRSPWEPVALVDDDPWKRRLRIDGVRVHGTIAQLPQVMASSDAATAILAIPTADGELVARITGYLSGSSTKLLRMPPTQELLAGEGVKDLRGIDLGDFLGRGSIELDADAIRSVVEARTVLVTGAGGSIGSELCRQISNFNPGQLIMLDRDESALHATQLLLFGQGLLDTPNIILADLRDEERILEIMQEIRPEVVFHAAALKHLPLLERYPGEAWKTNVLGTRNMLTAALIAGVEVFVNVSTDKAADPTCVLGDSKRVTERLTSAMARTSPGTYVSVRFGNVLGSRGSVIEAFRAQIERGGPVTVTDPEVERYFMLIPEACQLVLQAAACGTSGDVMVLAMGSPVRIAKVAQTLIELSGRDDVEITYTGLRPGEKLSEDLFSERETATRSSHPLVSRVSVPPLSVEQVDEALVTDPASARELMKRLAGPDASVGVRA